MRLTQEQVQNILFYKREGWTNKRIALKYQTNRSTIDRWITRLRQLGHDIPVDHSTWSTSKVNLNKIVKVK